MSQPAVMDVRAVPVPDPAELTGSAPEVVVIAVRPAPGPDEPVTVAPADETLLAGWGVDLARRLNRVRATGARSETTWIDLEAERPRAVLALGLGSASPADLRRSAAAAVRRLRGVESAMVLATADLDAAGVRAFAEGSVLATGAVSWATKPPPAPPGQLALAVVDPELGPAAVAHGCAHAGATLAARRLIHTPANLMDPDHLAQEAARVAQSAGVELRTWHPDELLREGFGGLLAVGAGSVHGPRLVALTRAADAPPPGVPEAPVRRIVLVGKGITFDSGGLSLKPADGQVAMKTDMSGAAVVCAVIATLGDRVPPGVQVTGLLCLAENLPGAAATRPGDVVTHHGGLTSEVVNTDAEGRLVLADGLDYAVRDLAADVVVDVATLTGAATLGLGRRHAAMFATSDVLAEGLRSAGEAAGEQVWRMPLLADYAPLIASEVAHQANAGRGGGPSPGAITAALFLHRFVGDTSWAHLDVAGTGRSEAERDDLPKGGTGFGARLLLRWIEAGAPA